jgi:hypothetical protein
LDANKLLGRVYNIEINACHSQNLKLQAQIKEIGEFVQETLARLEVTYADGAQKNESTQATSDATLVFQLKEANVGLKEELSHAKRSLVLYIGQVKQLESMLDLEDEDPSIQQALIFKFSAEINRLKQENEAVIQQRDAFVAFYKDQVAQLQSQS